ncbi:hypothetical protein GCM10009601_21410 [Streptomyces thermospinosisporus]|uniref:Nuclear transport factor 2 family protein n=1 Tax=Streptomyces thermospinosisporus TaxID=161482 RepID=A0ABN1YSB0_9ACTN
MAEREQDAEGDRLVAQERDWAAAIVADDAERIARFMAGEW